MSRQPATDLTAGAAPGTHALVSLPSHPEQAQDDD